MASTDLALTLADLRRRTLDLARDTPSLVGTVWTGERFSDNDQVKEYVNEAVEEFCERTSMLRTHQIIQLYEDVYLYDLASDVFRVSRVWFSDFSGWCVCHGHSRAWCSWGGTYDLTGDVHTYFRDLVPRGQIWVYPVPHQDGSSFIRDSEFGLLRAIRDDDGNYLTFDANRALRTIDGCMFEVTGAGHIIREVIVTTGNLRVDYERYPVRMSNEDDYPDSTNQEIPDHYHKVIPFLAAGNLLRALGEIPEDFQLSDRRLAEASRMIETVASEPMKEILRGGFRPG